MPIKNKLRLIMAERRINNISDLMSMTGLSRNALNKLWHDEDLESVKLGTLIQVCKALGIDLSDLIEYKSEKDGSQ